MYTVKKVPYFWSFCHNSVEFITRRQLWREVSYRGAKILKRQSGVGALGVSRVSWESEGVTEG